MVTFERRRPNALGFERAAIMLRDERLALNHASRARRARWDGLELTWDGGSLGAPVRPSTASFRLDGDEVALRTSFGGTRAAPAMLVRPQIRRLLDAALDERFGHPMSPKPHKVFCVGFRGTGTTSILDALRLLRYFARDAAPWLLPEIQSGRRRFDLIREYDAFAGTPFPLIFQALDREYPGSKFVLTVRDVDDWWDRVGSEADDWATAPTMERYLHGIDGFDAVSHRERYLRHIDAVERHFRGRRDALLVLDGSSVDHWHPLCEFLGEAVPDDPSPRPGGGPRDPSLPLAV